MKVTQVLQDNKYFYLCDKHLKKAKIYNPDLVIIEIGDSHCDLCEKENEGKKHDRLWKQARNQYDNP